MENKRKITKNCKRPENNRISIEIFNCLPEITYQNIIDIYCNDAETNEHPNELFIVHHSTPVNLVNQKVYSPTVDL